MTVPYVKIIRLSRKGLFKKLSLVSIVRSSQAKSQERLFLIWKLLGFHGKAEDTNSWEPEKAKMLDFTSVNCSGFNWKAGDTNSWIAKKPQILESPNLVKGPGFHERERARATNCETTKVKVLVSFSLIKDVDFVERPLCWQTCYSCIQTTLERLENMHIGCKAKLIWI